MKTAFPGLLLLTAAVAGTLAAQQANSPQTGEGDSPKVVYSDRATVAATLAKGSSATTAAMISRGDDHLVAAGRRTAPGVAERHDKAYDIVYITEGEATYVTGGTLKDSRQTGPGEMLGGTIEGGETHRLKTGDTIVVPPGVPHWWKETSGVTYMIIKVIRP